MRNAWIARVGAALAVLTIGSAANADVVAPPPDGVCPEGTHANSSHGMEAASCTPDLCADDGVCADGLACAERRYCYDGAWAVQTCASADDCPEGFPCTALDVCVADDGSGDDGGDDSCSAAGRGMGPAGGIAAALGLLALLLWRRQRR